MCIRRGGKMKKIIIKNTCKFNQYTKESFDKALVKDRVKSHFGKFGFEVDFVDVVGEDNYVEIICSGSLCRSDKNYLLNVYQRGFGKNVAFIKSEPMFFALVDDYVPAVI